jgi:ribosomal protein S18 acetylase RimI-like enzyme
MILSLRDTLGRQMHPPSNDVSVTVADHRDSRIAARIHAVLQGAYAVEAGWIGCADFPPLRETVADVQRSADIWLVIEWEGDVLGVLSYEAVGMEVTITRLVVRPDWFRRGMATALLQELERRVAGGTQVLVSTAEVNVGAIGVYSKQGFRVGARLVAREGIVLRQLYKQLG